MSARDYNALAVRVLKGDLVLNVALGVAFMALPGPIEAFLANGPLIPFIVWRVIGAIFILYAIWERVVTSRPPLSAASLAFASVMALVPVLLLTVALVFVQFPLKPIGRAVLWLGDGLMLVLGVFYAQVIRKMRHGRSDAGP